ncbi:30S ribosomal protein S6 [Alphaproteobacteria bacterium]|jgi:small subunit ribosomal protein S6|nr:30S ribosomal protein S6 [Alphaproteobacteria bacterium]
MTLYESVFIARQDVSATQVDSLTDSFEKIIVDNGGSVERRENWGLRTLAYRIKKNRKGHYVMLNINAPSDAVQEMERNMRLNEDILRYMTIKIEGMRDDASPIMQGKGDRDRDRADRGPSESKRDDNAQPSIAPVETTMEPSETVTEEAAKMEEETPVAEAAEEKKETKE